LNGLIAQTHNTNIDTDNSQKYITYRNATREKPQQRYNKTYTMDYIYVRSKMNVGLFNITQGITKKQEKVMENLKKTMYWEEICIGVNLSK